MKASVSFGVAALVLGGAAVASADTFGGFSSVERVYLVNSDRVCALVAVADGGAAGTARCERASADRLAALSFRAVESQRGAKAKLAARAEGQALVITRADGAAVVQWQALDPIAKVLDVFAGESDQIAVTFAVRRGGRDQVAVIGFDLRGAKATSPTLPPPTTTQPPVDTPPTTTPELAKELEAARKAKGKAALAAWQRVLDRWPGHAEALLRKAVALAARDKQGALAALEALAASTSADAIEHQVAARFDPAFAKLRADPAFRKAVRLGQPAQHPFEKVMGFGGKWEQAGTSCDSPSVALTFAFDKTFRLAVRTVCEGMVHQSKFSGRWQVQGQVVALTLPNRGAADDIVACAFEPAGDEEALACPLDEDLRIHVLPVRR